MNKSILRMYDLSIRTNPKSEVQYCISVNTGSSELNLGNKVMPVADFFSGVTAKIREKVRLL